MLGRRKKDAEPPSGIESPDQIDFVSLPPSKSSIDMHIAQNVEWDGSDRIVMLLQEKVHSYVSFALDGQLAATYPELAHLPWRIVLDCQSEPDPLTADVLAKLVEPIAHYGGSLVVRRPGDLYT